MIIRLSNISKVYHIILQFMEDNHKFCETERVVTIVFKELFQNIRSISHRNQIQKQLEGICPKIYERYWSEMSQIAFSHQTPHSDGKIFKPKRIVSQSGEELKDKYHQSVLRRSISKLHRSSKQMNSNSHSDRNRFKGISRKNSAKYNKIIPLKCQTIPQQTAQSLQYERRVNIFRMKKEKLEEAMKAFKQEDKIVEQFRSSTFNCKSFKQRASFTTDFKGKLLNFSKTVASKSKSKNEDRRTPNIRIHTEVETQSFQSKDRDFGIGQQRSSKLINYTNIQELNLFNQNSGRKTDKPSPIYITDSEGKNRAIRKVPSKFKFMRPKGTSAKSGFCKNLDFQNLRITKEKIFNESNPKSMKKTADAQNPFAQFINSL